MCVGGAGEARRGRRVAGRRDKRERNVSGRRTDRQPPTPGDTRTLEAAAWTGLEAERRGLTPGERPGPPGVGKGPLWGGGAGPCSPSPQAPPPLPGLSRRRDPTSHPGLCS